MNAFLIPLGEMVGRAELAEFFQDDSEGVLEFIELLGTERDLRYARLLPFARQVDVLWDILQRQLSGVGKSRAAGRLR